MSRTVPGSQTGTAANSLVNTMETPRTELVDYSRSLSSYHRRRQKPAPLSLFNLGNLPVEIVLCIMDFLPPESAVALSFSCSQLKCLVGPQQLSKISSSTIQTLALLNLLAIDLPNCVACAPCKKLHEIENFQRYNSAPYRAGLRFRPYHCFRLPACVAQDREDGIGVITHLFGVTAFKMVIKEYHQHHDYKKILSIMSDKAAQTVEYEDYVLQSREECIVVRGHLMHRLQNVRISNKHLYSKNFAEDPDLEIICPHISHRRDMYEYRGGINRCRVCCTEYSINVKDYPGHGRAIFFTRWKDLGTGPEDKVWKQHITPTRLDRIFSLIEGFLAAETATVAQTQVKCQSHAMGISYAFGDMHDFKFDSWLTPENESELLRLQEQCVTWQQRPTTNYPI